MATVADRILDHLAEIPAGLDDGQLAAALGASRSTVNNACRRLSEQGRLFRGPGPSGVIVNRVINSAASGVAESPAAAAEVPADGAAVGEPKAAAEAASVVAEPDVVAEPEAAEVEVPAGGVAAVDSATPFIPAVPEPAAAGLTAAEPTAAPPAAAEPAITAPAASSSSAAAVPVSDDADGGSGAAVEPSQGAGRVTGDTPGDHRAPATAEDSAVEKADVERSGAATGAPEPDTEPAAPARELGAGANGAARVEVAGDAPAASKVGTPPVRRSWWRRFRKS